MSSSNKIGQWRARTAAEGAAGTAVALSLLSILAGCPREGGPGGFDKKATSEVVVVLPRIFRRRATASTAAATTAGRRPAAFRPRRLRGPRATAALRRAAGSKATRGRATAVAAPVPILQAAVGVTTPSNGPGNLVLAGSLRGRDGAGREGAGLGKEGANTTTTATEARRKNGTAIVDEQATIATADSRTRTIAAGGTFPAAGKGAGLVGEGGGGVGGGGGLTAGATTEATAEQWRWAGACRFSGGHEAAL